MSPPPDEPSSGPSRVMGLLRTRWVPVGAPVLVAAVIAFTHAAWGRTTVDYMLVRQGSQLLMDGHLDVYGQMPGVQMGPLAVAMAALPWWLYAAILVLLLGVTLEALVRCVGTGSRATLCLGLGGLLAVLPWTYLLLWGHADELLVLTGAALLVLAGKRRNPALATGAFVLAVVGKPTAAMILPLVFLVSWPAGLAATAIAALLWAPFVLADVHGFFVAGQGVVGVHRHSLAAWLGAPIGSPYPGWVRPAELAVAVAVCLTVGRRSFPAAIAFAFTFRVLAEPAAFTEYLCSVIVAGVMVDVLAGRRWPVIGTWAAAVTVVTWWPLSVATSLFRFVMLVALMTYLAAEAYRARVVPDAPAERVEDVVLIPSA